MLVVVSEICVGSSTSGVRVASGVGRPATAAPATARGRAAALAHDPALLGSGAPVPSTAHDL
jgi:hypothetical protein